MASLSAPQLNWAALAHLLSAPSKRTALKCFNRAFVHRNAPTEVFYMWNLLFILTMSVCLNISLVHVCLFQNMLQMPLAAMATEFSITEPQASELAAVLVHIVKSVLYESDPEATMRSVDAKAVGLDVRLRGLIEQVLKFPPCPLSLLWVYPRYSSYFQICFRVWLDYYGAAARVARSVHSVAPLSAPVRGR